MSPNERQLAEHSLAALREVAAGDFYSVIHFHLQTLETEVFFPNQGWLKSGNTVLDAIQKKLTAHPLMKKFLANQRPMVLLRSQVVPDQTWRCSVIYNEVDRPLGIEDLATVYQTTPSGTVMALTCGRSRRFSNNDFAAIQNYHRVLNGLVPFYTDSLNPSRSQPGRTSGVNTRPLPALTTREHEILQWVREGKRNKEIAIILGLSHLTVRRHLENIFHKLGVETRAAAVNAMDWGGS